MFAEIFFDDNPTGVVEISNLNVATESLADMWSGIINWGVVNYDLIDVNIATTLRVNISF